jgi:hypothetical protein
MSLIELTIPAREADIGGLAVRRLLPWQRRRMVGPFIFLDHMGPAHFGPGHGMDVQPHPHIGLSTVTYLFDGEIVHRDSLGSDLPIRPGAVNWMTAGRGIAHSERTGADERGRPHDVHGLQCWVALPREYEETAPAFSHFPATAIPQLDLNGVRLRVVAGAAFGMEAPAAIHSPQFYVEAKMNAGATLDLPAQYRERGMYVISGTVRAGGETVALHTLPVFEPGGTVRIEAVTDAHVMFLGGDPLPEKRFIWWNFVSTSPDRIEQAKADWQAGRFPLIPGDSTAFVPLPPDKRS